MSKPCWVIAFPVITKAGEPGLEYWGGPAVWRHKKRKARRFFSKQQAWEFFCKSEFNPGLREKVRVIELPPSSCSSGKWAFDSEAQALQTLLQIWSERPNREERRTYRCPDCSNWHLTKAEQRTQRRQ